jgi:hypothetical protein
MPYIQIRTAYATRITVPKMAKVREAIAAARFCPELRRPEAPIAPLVTPKSSPNARKSSGLMRRARKIHFWRMTTTIPVTTTMTTVCKRRRRDEGHRVSTLIRETRERRQEGVCSLNFRLRRLERPGLWRGEWRRSDRRKRERPRVGDRRHEHQEARPAQEDIHGQHTCD